MTRKWMQTGLILSLALCFGTTQAPASEITLTSSHDITMTITPLSSGSPMSPESGTVGCSMEGIAAHYPNYYYINGIQNPVSPTPGTATVSLPEQQTWLRTQTGTATAITLGEANLSTNIVGWGPSTTYINGNSIQYGYNKQKVVTLYDWSFTAPAAGSYTVKVSDAYTVHLQLDQAAGSPYPLYYLNAYNEQYLFNSVNGSSIGFKYIKPLNYFVPQSYGEPLENVNLGYLKTEYLEFVTYLNGGDTITGSWVGRSYYEGRTMGMPSVPLPSTVLLLGSSLLGLAGWRRFRKS
jgi:hypothetical protein